MPSVAAVTPMSQQDMGPCHLGLISPLPITPSFLSSTSLSAAVFGLTAPSFQKAAWGFGCETVVLWLNLSQRDKEVMDVQCWDPVLGCSAVMVLFDRIWFLLSAV